jgi:glycosyltransferase involved in cell wall biosynthesis
MVFIFWQGIISIHQKAFLEALALMPVTKVLLVVEEEITPYRKNMGWEVPVIEHVEIIKSPDTNIIKALVKEHKDAVHVMGGIKVGHMISVAFDECIWQQCRMGIMTEPFNPANFKGWLRGIKYRYYQLRYSRHIQFVLAIGKKGVEQYEKLGFDTKIIFPWAYFISLAPPEMKPERDTAIRRIIYAGRLEAGKGIYPFVKELLASGNSNFTFKIYGTGPDEVPLKELVFKNNAADKISFYPFLNHDELVEQYLHADWVVLPSTQKDGWGVIVSEGLLNGLKAICSNICGVSWVIKDGFNGVVFGWAEGDNCVTAINKMLTEDRYASRKEIMEWANNAISGKAGAAYFMEIIDSIYRNKEKPAIPWIID